MDVPSLATVVDVPSLSMVLTWQDSGRLAQFVNDGCAPFVKGSHLARQ